ncbi:MAG: RNA methyltransferase [Candidatus Omnitrophica bacterium]|nr:RNA methyltransferase [Candidatus Omnitrophota bacterium]
MRLFGKNSAIERLRAQPQTVRKIYLEEGFADAANVRQKAKKTQIPVLSVPFSKMRKMSQGKNTQGILLDVDEFKYTPYEELLEAAVTKRTTLLFIDRLKDPQNLGAIIRSLACLGRFAVILPTHESVSVTETVLHIASGGDNYVPVALVGNLNNAIREAKDQGYWIGGAVVGQGEDLREVVLPPRVGLVIGSEEKGIRDVVQKNLDQLWTVPMAHDTLSLNAAHAVTVFCYEIERQKKIHKDKSGSVSGGD